MSLHHPEAAAAHNVKIAAEVQLGLDAGAEIWIPAFTEGLPDVRVAGEWIDVKQTNESHRGTVSQRQFDEFAEKYQDLVFAIWSREGRITLTPAELMERAERYRGEVVRPGVDGKGPYYLFDCSADEFVNPFRQGGGGGGGEGSGGLETPEFGGDPAAQLTLDGRAVVNTHAGALGARQRELLETLAYRGSLTTTEAGVLIHALSGGCPPSGDRPDKNYDKPYSGAGCCRKAADEGAIVMGHMARQGRVWKHEDQWMLYPEMWDAA